MRAFTYIDLRNVLWHHVTLAVMHDKFLRRQCNNPCHFPPAITHAPPDIFWLWFCAQFFSFFSGYWLSRFFTGWFTIYCGRERYVAHFGICHAAGERSRESDSSTTISKKSRVQKASWKWGKEITSFSLSILWESISTFKREKKIVMTVFSFLFWTDVDLSGDTFRR